MCTIMILNMLRVSLSNSVSINTLKVIFILPLYFIFIVDSECFKVL